MAEDISGVLQEISELLRRLSEQNEASFRRQEEFRMKVEGGKDWREEAKARREQFRTQMESLREKSAESLDRRRDEDQAFRERLLQTLEQQNKLLEVLISRIKDRPS